MIRHLGGNVVRKGRHAKVYNGAGMLVTVISHGGKTRRWGKGHDYENMRATLRRAGLWREDES